ncbi:MAG: SET domain-containing protein [Myxococcales bacterium FL481]|nr:MAG: SET domain-containing protein [Myxococcales bacterium FL481]
MLRTAFEPSASPNAPRKRRAVVGRSNIGKGVFAGRALQRGEVVGRVRGTLVDDAQVDPYYCMEMDNGLFLVPKAPFRYLNHRCVPNCRLFMWEDEPIDPQTNTRALYVEALRSIRVGSELTIDYGWPAYLAIPCHCSSRRCRGYVVDPSQLGLVRKQARAKSRAAQLASR